VLKETRQKESRRNVKGIQVLLPIHYLISEGTDLLLFCRQAFIT
jgi:hypothetical protein